MYNSTRSLHEYLSKKSKVKGQKSEHRGQTKYSEPAEFYSLFTMHNSLFTNKGFALVSALIVMTLLAALGSAAFMMTNMGFAAVSAERRYQLANWAADYAIGAGASFVIDNAICPPSTTITPCASLASGATCDYFSIPDVTGTFCTIYSKGKLGTAQVIKTAVVPRMGSDWGGIITRGGTITLSGSAAIAGCDDDEASYANKCGMMPALIAPPVGTNLSLTSTSDVATKCDTEGPMKGLFGNPPHYIMSDIPDDLVPKYFGVTDANNNGSAWDEFLGLLEGKYSIDITPLDASSPGTPAPANSIPGTCKSEPDQFCCKTTSNTQITCYNKSDCTGTVVKTIDLALCRNGTAPNPSDNPIFVKIDAPIRIEHNISQGITTNPDLRNASSTSSVTISAALTASPSGDATKISTGGSVTANSNVTGSSITAGSNITVNANVTNSNLISGATAAINLDAHELMQNTNVFSTNLNFDLKSSGDRVAGGTFYALNSTTIRSTGGPNLGTVANPILLLAGNTNMSVPGNLTINGLIYTTATNVSITGAVELQGALINNSTTANISNTGNGTIQFNKQVLDNLYTRVSDLMNKPKCGGGNKKDWIANTKMTLY